MRLNPVVVASTGSSVGGAIGTGVAATVVWTAFVLGWRRWRQSKALQAFVGDYEAQRRHSHTVDKVHIERDGHDLRVEMLELENGPARGRITLSDRFPESGRGAYEHHFSDGDHGWGTWDVQLASSRDVILVTTRWADPVRQVEVVQGYEWRRTQAKTRR